MIRRSHFSIAFAALSLLAINANAQGFYFTAGGGYNLASNYITNVNMAQGFEYQMGTNYLLAYSNNIFSFNGYNFTSVYTGAPSRGTNTNTTQNLHIGMGGGENINFSAGYSFSQYISVELGFSCLLSPQLHSTSTYTNYAYPDSLEDNIVTDNYLKSSPRYRITPEVKLSLPLKKLTPYIKLGFLMDVGGSITVTNNSVETGLVFTSGGPPSTLADNAALVAKGGVGLGYVASLGAEYGISKVFSLYLEFNVVSDNWSPTAGTITEYDQSITPYQPGYSVTPISGESFSYSNNSSISYTTPRNLTAGVTGSSYPKQTISFGSYGLTLGVKIAIPKAAAKAADAKAATTAQ